jgi:branched-chain amino acid transport system permease protein
MRDFLSFTILGLVTAAIYAVAASGLVVTYTTSGIFNFAHGAIGMMSAFAYWQLAYGWGVPTPLAIVLVLVVAAPLFGWLLDRSIFRGLQGTSEVTRVVVSIGLTFGLIALAPIIWSSRQNRKVQPLFGGNKVTIFDVGVTYHQLTIMAVAVLVAIGLRLLLFGTRSGVNMRAVVDNRSLAQLNGARPNRASALSWALGCSLASLAGILIADQLGLEVVALTFLVVNAYAAAIVGRLTSLPLTFLGAAILGLLQSYASGYLPKNPSWLPEGIDLVAPLRLAIPVIMLFVVLLLLPQSPLRVQGLVRSRESVPRPTLSRSAIGFGLVILATAVLTVVLDPKNMLSWSRAFAFGLIMLSLVPLTGYGGQISLAQISFAGLGAYAVAQWGGTDTFNPLGIVLGVGIAAAVGALVALPALRLRGIYLALATLAFAFFMEKVVFIQQAVFGAGARPVQRPPGFEGDGAFMILMAVVFCIVGFGVVWLRLGPFGRRLQAMKDSPAACATLGLNLTVTKLQVFVLSAAIAGLGGAMLAMLQKSASPANFDTLQGLPILLMAVAGGIAMVSGALTGGVLLASFPVIGDAVPPLANLLAVAPGLIGISLGRNPNGIANEVSTKLRTFRLRSAARRAGSEATEELAIAEAGRRWRLPMEPLADVESMGLDRPFTADDLALIDRVLSLDEEEVSAGAFARRG